MQCKTHVAQWILVGRLGVVKYFQADPQGQEFASSKEPLNKIRMALDSLFRERVY